MVYSSSDPPAALVPSLAHIYVVVLVCPLELRNLLPEPLLEHRVCENEQGQALSARC